MVFNKTSLDGAYTIDLDKKGDNRGFFARVFCENEVSQMNIESNIVQINNSLSPHTGTLRGMHYQKGEASETKIIRCIKGKIFDVILDLRKESKTFGKWFGENLSADNRRMMYVPRGFAHGFITLADDTEIIYFVSNFYNPELERGLKWNDTQFNIVWPIEPLIISDKDKNWPDFNPEFHL